MLVDVKFLVMGLVGIWLFGVICGLVVHRSPDVSRHADILSCWWKLNVSYSHEVAQLRSALQHMGVPLMIAGDQAVAWSALGAIASASWVSMRRYNASPALT